jgi:phosphoglycerate-specific signal transduction histidine kinase
MGLNTVLDADALSEAIIKIVAESRSDELLTLYLDERSRVFQSFVDSMQQPFPTLKMLHYEDSFFRIL